MTDKSMMLTTIDNPYSPFTEYEDWDSYDRASGHHTNALLARVVVTSDELSESDQEEAIDEAILEIVKENVSGMHRIAYS